MSEAKSLLRHIPAEHPTDDDAPDHLAGGRNRCHYDPGALAFLIREYGVKSMLDIGCGLGCMVEYARTQGLEAWGLDGDGHGDPDFLWDFTVGPCLDLPKVDLLWSLEFLEHIDEVYIDHYMPSFAKGRVVMATHAPPGKAGRHHVNCREQPYWEDAFMAWGFTFEGKATEGLREASEMLSIEWDGQVNLRKHKRFIADHGMIFTR